MPKGKTDKPVRIRAMVTQAPEDDLVPLSFESPESSNIASAMYDPSTMVMIVSFKGHGSEERQYESPGVITMAQWEAFLQAPSKGKFFAQEIAPLYSFVRLL